MRKNIIKLHEEINRINELNGSNIVSGKHLVVVDIQPEYLSGFKYFLSDFVNFLNKNYEHMTALTFLYNGADTLGMISESDYKWWWIENGVEEHIIDGAIFYDKGYAFFRYCIDSNIDDNQIINLVKYMMSLNVNDSRDLDEEFWNGFIEKYGDNDIRELLEFSDDMLNIPDLMGVLKNYRGVVLCGGGINECLKEVEIALNALNNPYKILTEYTY